MKILHVITSLRIGGAEKLMVDLLPRLKKSGHDVELLLFDGTDTPFRQKAEASGIKIYDLGKGGSVYSPSRLFKFLPFLKRYDIVHTHNTSPQLFAALASVFNHCKLITTEHGGSNRRRKWKYYKKVDRWMYNRYDKVICISQKAEDNLRQYLRHCKAEITTINNGVDVAKFATAHPSQDLEQIAPGSRKIIMVAGFRWEKDQDTLIKAMTNLPDKFHLFLIGDGARRNELEKLIEDRALTDRVHLLGIRSDIPELLHAADYVVMSSHFEGLSLSSVEGMSVGKPFIASDVDGLREVVKDAGLLFTHKDPNNLADMILYLESDYSKYKKIAKECAQRALNFDISSMVSSYAECYRNI